MYMLLSRIFWVYIVYLQVITWHGSSTQESQLCMNPCSLLEERSSCGDIPGLGQLIASCINKIFNNSNNVNCYRFQPFNNSIIDKNYCHRNSQITCICGTICKKGGAGSSIPHNNCVSARNTFCKTYILNSRPTDKTSEKLFGSGLREHMNSLEVDDISNGISNILSSVSKRGGRLDDDGAENIYGTLDGVFGAGFMSKWSRISNRGASDIVMATDGTAFQLANDFIDGMRNSTYTFKGSNIALNFQRFKPRRPRLERFSSDKVYGNNSLTEQASIEIPFSALCDDDTENCSVVVGVSVIDNLADYIQETLENSTINATNFTNSSVASVLLSAYVYDSEVSVEKLKNDPLVLSFVLNTSHLDFDGKNLSYKCVFLDTENFVWSDDGLEIIEIREEEGRINCTSTHLTSFAVLVSLTGITSANPAEDTALTVVTYVGCAVSIVCLIAAIILLIILRKKLDKGVLLYIHLNLSFSLLLAFLVFVAGLETATSIPVLCIIISALIEYFFMCSLFWMLGEGIMLYLLIVRVFGKLHTRWYLLLPFCWGVPLIIVGISVGVLHEDHYTESYCWIKADPTKPALWIFVVPMMIVILINSLILARTVYAIVRGKKVGGAESEVKNTELVKTTIKSSVILMPLLGLTWIFGLFAVNENTTVFAWLFTILNSFQGLFIFLLHIMRSGVVYKAIKDCFIKNCFGRLLKQRKFKAKTSITIDKGDSKISNPIYSDFDKSFQNSGYESSSSKLPNSVTNNITNSSTQIQQ